MQLAVKSWVMMSGTLPHNKWYDVSGYLDFIKGHPYTTKRDFSRQFVTTGYSGEKHPTGPQMRLRQRFIQTFLIMRSRDVLDLPPCKRLAFPVNLEDVHPNTILQWTKQYRRAVAMDES